EDFTFGEWQGRGYGCGSFASVRARLAPTGSVYVGYCRDPRPDGRQALFRRRPSADAPSGGLARGWLVSGSVSCLDLFLEVSFGICALNLGLISRPTRATD